MIHSLNKNETALHGTERIDSRTNIIVMGDSLGDADMTNGSPASSQILKIGFLLEHVSFCRMIFSILITI